MSLTTLSVQAFLEQLAENKININACDITEESKELFFRDKKRLDSESSLNKSEGSMHFANLISETLKGSIPVALKVFPKARDNNTDDVLLLGLQYECKVYKYIYENIIKSNYSPNFISYVASACCSNNLCVLITGQAGSGEYFGLNDMYEVHTLNSIFEDLLEIDRMKVLFQIFYSLELMQRFKIVHYDLHINNIMVVDFEYEIPFEFIIGEDKFTFYSRYVPYLFDWDFAYCEPLGDNPRIYDYAYLNIFNRMSKKADTYTLLCMLYQVYDFKDLFDRIPKIRMAEKEQNIVFSITDKQKDLIKSYKPYAIGLYKFSGSQLNEILDRDMKMDYAIIKFTENEDGIVIYNPFICRSSMIPKNFPTPLETLKTKFNFFKRDLDDFKTQFSYVMPEPPVIPSKIFIDPFSTSKRPLNIRDYIKTKNKTVKTRDSIIDIPLKKVYY